MRGGRSWTEHVQGWSNVWEINALLHYWLLRQKTPEQQIHKKYLTKRNQNTNPPPPKPPKQMAELLSMNWLHYSHQSCADCCCGHNWLSHPRTQPHNLNYSEGKPCAGAQDYSHCKVSLPEIWKHTMKRLFKEQKVFPISGWESRVKHYWNIWLSFSGKLQTRFYTCLVSSKIVRWPLTLICRPLKSLGLSLLTKA